MSLADLKIDFHPYFWDFFEKVNSPDVLLRISFNFTVFSGEDMSFPFTVAS